jgi:dimeric dUTPase (all-alpha-NTP-PPase superfamily)
MMISVDFRDVQKEQRDYQRYLEKIEGIKKPNDEFVVPMWVILALSSELGEILNESKVHKWWDREEVDRDKLIEECSDFLSHMANIANILEVDLVVEKLKFEGIMTEKIINRLLYRITTLDNRKGYARIVLIKHILPLFLELIHSLGIDLIELEKAYDLKMSENYLRFI